MQCSHSSSALSGLESMHRPQVHVPEEAEGFFIPAAAQLNPPLVFGGGLEDTSFVGERSARHRLQLDMELSFTVEHILHAHPSFSGLPRLEEKLWKVCDTLGDMVVRCFAWAEP